MVDAGVRHRLLAILAADAEGYSRLMASDEAAALAALDAARQAFRSETLSHQGRIVDTAGDSVLAVFDTASGALDCAVAVQQQLVAVAPAPRLPFRIGVHLGDVIERADGSVYGNGVNVASRLQSLAGGDEIWLSAAVRDAVGGGAARRFLDMGLHTVKNIDEPLHAYLMDWRRVVGASRAHVAKPRRLALWTLAGASLLGIALSALLSSGAWRGAVAHGDAQALRPLSLAIGPIAAVPADPRAAEVAERLRNDLRNQLTGPFYRNVISVIAEDSAIGVSTNAARALNARAGGARFLVEGTVRADGDHHVASIHLVDVAGSTRAWSGDVQVPGAATQRELAARKLGRQLAGFIRTNELRRVLATPVDQLSAGELYLRAAAVYDSNPTLAGIDQSLSLLERALRLDPNSVTALNGKAYMLLNRYDEEASPDDDRYARQLDALSSRALAIDRRDALAWANRAIALRFARQWTAALEAADELARLDPSEPMGRLIPGIKAETLIALGRPADALQLLQTESQREGDINAFVLLYTCQAQLLLLQTKAASDACERGVGRDPRWWSAHLFLASARAQLGDLEGAHASLAIVEQKSPGQTIDRLRRNPPWSNPEYQRLAEAAYYPGLRQAGMREH